MNETLFDMIVLYAVLGVCLAIIMWAAKRGDPISRFARGAFKMKLDRSTGQFWAKPRMHIQPPAICPNCARTVCVDGAKRPGWTLVDCPRFTRKEMKT